MVFYLDKNYVFLHADRGIFQHGRSPASQRGHDESRQNLQSQVHVRHVFEEHYVWDDAHQVRV